MDFDGSIKPGFGLIWRREETSSEWALELDNPKCAGGSNRSEDFGRPAREIPTLDFRAGLKNPELLPAEAKQKRRGILPAFF
ncbi:hypothetical protein [Shouchella shacheensis]|uniref:hypothetical protein n=1 Tax=Shouchella shacheensis TaxID=1649580 RepID=UPI0007402213|nr:hypothetical protein [Shouchella shacheensis]